VHVLPQEIEVLCPIAEARSDQLAPQQWELVFQGFESYIGVFRVDSLVSEIVKTYFISNLFGPDASPVVELRGIRPDWSGQAASLRTFEALEIADGQIMVATSTWRSSMSHGSPAR
jgi:hypothetical protein